MRLLDPKEEVYKIKFTPYGKYLLSHGKFNPVYYAFFDDDIIYDSSYLSGTGDTTEAQNSIQDRILNETPRFEGQTSFEGSDATVFATNANILEPIFPGIGDKLADKSYNITILERPVNQYFLQNPLGRSAYNTNKAPYYTLDMITGTIASAGIVGITATDSLEEKVPTTFIDQVNIDFYNTFRRNFNSDFSQDETPSENVQDDNLFDSFYIFPDGTSLHYEKNKIFIKLEEGNTDFLKENFDIEVFEVIEKTELDSDGVEQLTGEENFDQYYFTKDNEDPGNKNVEYYFNLKFDNEIEESYYCEALRTNDRPNKTKDIFSDNTFKCPDKTQERKNVNIYNTDVPQETEPPC